MFLCERHPVSRVVVSRVNVDVAVVGRELCGLVAGALCAQAGRRVMVIDDGEQHARVLGDRLAPLTPTLWRLPGGPVGAVLDELGFKADARRVLGDPVGLAVVDDPDLRCVFPVSDDARVRELGRALGDSGRTLARALQSLEGGRRHPAFSELRFLNEDGWFFQARRARKRVLHLGPVGSIDVDDADASAVWGDGSGVAPVLSQLASFVQWRSQAPARGLGAALAMSTLQGGSVLGGPGAGLGPIPAFADMLLGFITHHGGEVVKDRVASVETQGRVITALRTEHRRDEVVAVAVIDGTSARDLVDRLPSGRPREKLLTQQGKVVVVGGATSVRWLLPVRVLPRGMPPLMLALDPAGALPTLIGIYGGAAPSETGKGSHLDEQLVCVVATANTRESGPVEETLNRIMPFARSAARAADVVDASAVATHYEIKDSEHILGGRRPRTALKNLVRAGRDLAPAWGTDGEIVAARSVFALVDKLFPKQPPST
jgi:hypothetical protein